MSNCVSQSEWQWQAAVSYGRSGGVIPVASVATVKRGDGDGSGGSAKPAE